MSEIRPYVDQRACYIHTADKLEVETVSYFRRPRTLVHIHIIIGLCKQWDITRRILKGARVVAAGELFRIGRRLFPWAFFF